MEYLNFLIKSMKNLTEKLALFILYFVDVHYAKPVLKATKLPFLTDDFRLSVSFLMSLFESWWDICSQGNQMWLLLEVSREKTSL